MAGRPLHPLGGFPGQPQVPVPDLLSTATAMQALNFVECECNEAEIRNRCLHFLDTVWDEDRGAFCGHAFDRKVDSEYTWYGLLALGHLVDPEDDPIQPMAPMAASARPSTTGAPGPAGPAQRAWPLDRIPVDQRLVDRDLDLRPGDARCGSTRAGDPAWSRLAGRQRE